MLKNLGELGVSLRLGGKLVELKSAKIWPQINADDTDQKEQKAGSRRQESGKN